MIDPIEDKVYRWVQNGDEKFSDINLKINHLNHWLFSDYEPAVGPGPNFMKRLSDWLANIKDEEEQKILFELVTHIFYVGREELNVLYREAYQTIFARWIIDQIAKDFTLNTLEELNTEIANTWFCPFSDSLRINQFYHINDIPGTHDNRPDWKSLRTFADIEKLKNYISCKKIKRIVLLEDFIGSGDQISTTIDFITNNLPNTPVLIIPLIICPIGMEAVSQRAKTNPNIQITPVLCIPANYFVHEIEANNELLLFKKVNSLAKTTYPQVCSSTNYNAVPYGPFGFRKTGGVIVLHTNTPDNTLPLLHYKSETWNPLFKRHKRIAL